MTKLVFGSSLGLLAALVALPCIASAQTAPTTTPPPTEPAPLPAAPEAPVVATPPPAAEPAAPAMVDAPPVAPAADPAPVAVPVVLESEPEEAPAPSPTITGFVEAAYHANFTDLDANRAPSPLMAYYTPAGHSFVLHAAHLAISHSFNDNISATIEIDAGYDASWNKSYPFAGALFDVQEAYATYKSGSFSVTAGKFVTYEGIEVVEGPLNPTITRGYLFGLAEPVTHTGVKFHFTTDKVDLGIGIVNGWDAITDNNNMKTIIAKVGLTPSDSLLVNISGTFGSEAENVTDEHRLSLDLTGAWVASESFSLWFQGNYAMDGVGADEQVSWYGFGLQPTYTGETFTFGARAEFFSDPDNVRVLLGEDTSYVNFTLVPGFILAQGFKVRAELRADIATEDVLGKPEDLGAVMITAALGAEYVF